MDLSTNMSVSNTACVSLEEALEKAFGRDSEIVERKRLYGGDINDAYMLRLSGGKRVFMKTNSVRNYGFFAGRSRDLTRCARPGSSVCRSCWVRGRTGGRDFRFCCWSIWKARRRFRITGRFSGGSWHGCTGRTAAVWCRHRRQRYQHVQQKRRRGEKACRQMMYLV